MAFSRHIFRIFLLNVFVITIGICQSPSLSNSSSFGENRRSGGSAKYIKSHYDYSKEYPNVGIKRDSYTDPIVAGAAANTFSTGSSSYGAPQQGGYDEQNKASMYHFQVMPSQMSYGVTASNGWGESDDYEDDESGGGAGIAGASGALKVLKILALKKLKKKGVIKAFKAGVLLAPILGPLFAFILPIVLFVPLLVILAPLLLPLLLFFPIPVIASGRATERANVFTTMMNSDQCIERVSCELNRFAEKMRGEEFFKRIVKSKLKKGNWSERISKGLSEQNCSNLKCGPAKSLEQLGRKYKSYLQFNR